MPTSGEALVVDGTGTLSSASRLRGPVRRGGLGGAVTARWSPTPGGARERRGCSGVLYLGNPHTRTLEGEALCRRVYRRVAPPRRWRWARGSRDRARGPDRAADVDEQRGRKKRVGHCLSRGRLPGSRNATSSDTRCGLARTRRTAGSGRRPRRAARRRKGVGSARSRFVHGGRGGGGLDTRSRTTMRKQASGGDCVATGFHRLGIDRAERGRQHLARICDEPAGADLGASSPRFIGHRGETRATP